MAGGIFFGAVGPTPNLTPDDSGLPNGLTQQQFFDIMRKGVDPDGNPISTVMPWPLYRNMTDRDLRAIYEFLWAIPTSPDRVRVECMGQRLSSSQPSSWRGWHTNLLTV